MGPPPFPPIEMPLMTKSLVFQFQFLLASLRATVHNLIFPTNLNV